MRLHSSFQSDNLIIEHYELFLYHHVFVVVSEKPVYDFRHHFACANIARWAKERKDVISMLPYLMRYMGHSSLEKTYYYVHLIPDYFADYAAATENLESLLPEVEPYEI